MPFDLETSVRFGVRTALIAGIAASLCSASATSAEDAPAKANSARTQPAATAAIDQPTVTYTPTAGPWRDKLQDARRRVLDATAKLDDINAAYARALYEQADASQIAVHVKQRARAQKQLSEARAAIPPRVEGARQDGVSPRILELYEQATLR